MPVTQWRPSSASTMTLDISWNVIAATRTIKCRTHSVSRQRLPPLPTSQTGRINVTVTMVGWRDHCTLVEWPTSSQRQMDTKTRTVLGQRAPPAASFQSVARRAGKLINAGRARPPQRGYKSQQRSLDRKLKDSSPPMSVLNWINTISSLPRSSARQRQRNAVQSDRRNFVVVVVVIVVSSCPTCIRPRTPRHRPQSPADWTHWPAIVNTHTAAVPHAAIITRPTMCPLADPTVIKLENCIDQQGANSIPVTLTAFLPYFYFQCMWPSDPETSSRRTLPTKEIPTWFEINSAIRYRVTMLLRDLVALTFYLLISKSCNVTWSTHRPLNDLLLSVLELDGLNLTNLAIPAAVEAKNNQIFEIPDSHLPINQWC